MTWDEVASRYDVRRCSSCQSGNHTTGIARNGVIHWADRRMTKAGLRKYLMLIASQRLYDFANLPTWDRIYRSNVWAATEAARLHVRLSTRLSAPDRARVRWLSLGIDIPDHVRHWAGRR